MDLIEKQKKKIYKILSIINTKQRWAVTKERIGMHACMCRWQLCVIAPVSLRLCARVFQCVFRLVGFGMVHLMCMRIFQAANSHNQTDKNLTAHACDMRKYLQASLQRSHNAHFLSNECKQTKNNY